MIGELPLRRLRQVLDAIAERVTMRDKLRRVYIEWQTKTLAAFIAGTVPKQKHGKHPSKYVQDISLFPERERRSMPKSRPNDVPGSAEALMGMFPTEGPK